MANNFLNPITKIPKELNLLIMTVKNDTFDYEKYKTKRLYRQFPIQAVPLLDDYHLEVGYHIYYKGYDVIVDYRTQTIEVKKDENA